MEISNIIRNMIYHCLSFIDIANLGIYRKIILSDLGAARRS